MKHSLNELYITWLNQYHSLNKGCNVAPLIAKIAESTTIEDLIELLAFYLQSASAPYKAISFNSCLSSWKLELEKTMANHIKALAELNKVKVTAENKQLIMLLQEVLNEPPLLLHIQMSSLLQILCTSSLTELFDYILHLPQVAPPLNPRPGSFAAQIPQNQHHAACLQLLNNLASVINAGHPLWNNANGLLQSSLLLYNELDLRKVSLNHERTSKEAKNIKSCIFM